MTARTDVRRPDAGRVAQRFLSLMLNPEPSPPWEELFPAGDADAARATFFVLHREPDIDPATFIVELLRRLLRQLQVRTNRRLIEYRGRVRGRVDWPTTLKARHSGDHDPSKYVCSEVERDFDTPENQLVKFVIERVGDCLDAVPDIVRRGVCYYPAADLIDPVAIGDRVSELQADLKRLRVSPQLRYITLPDTVTGEHVRRADGSKMEEYGLVARLYERYDAAVRRRDWDGVVASGRHSIPLPGGVDAASEPWLQLAAAITRRNLSGR